MIEIALLTIVILTGFNYYISRDIAYPPFIFSLVWCIVFLCYIFFSKINFLPLYEISEFTLIIFIIGIFVFTLGGLIPFFYFNSQNDLSFQIKSITINYYFDNLLFYGIILISPIFIYKAIQISTETGVNNFFLGLRYGLSENETGGYGFLKYIIPIAIFNSYFRFFIYQNKKDSIQLRLKFYLSLLVAIIFLVLTTGRSNILLLITLIASLKLISSKINLKYIFSLGMGFFLIFFVFAVVLAKGGSIESDFSENISSVSKMFFWYLLGGIKAFDVFLQNQVHLNYGSFTFRFFYALGFKLGISSTAPTELVQPFLFLPLPTNVYTIYYTYIKDFGVMVAFLFIALFSIMHTIFYFRAKIGREGDRFFYALLIYPLIISIFQDQYFSLLSTWLQYTFFYLISFKLFTKIAYTSTN